MHDVAVTLGAPSRSAPCEVAAMSIADRKTPDRNRIEMEDGLGWRCFARHLGITPVELKEIVERVGNSAAAVRKEVEASGKRLK